MGVTGLQKAWVRARVYRFAEGISEVKGVQGWLSKAWVRARMYRVC